MPRKDGRRTAATPVSVIVPSQGEDSLGDAMRSILAQDHRGEIEVVIADSVDPAGTAARFPSARVVRNPRGSAAAGLNRALAASRHPVVVRCDAGSTLPPGYVSRAVETLERTGAANVGGRQAPSGATPFERAVALAMTSRLGAGGARYRVGGAAGPVDTVYLGVFRREALAAAGGFDESLMRNQDYELNFRLRDRGETVWFDPALAAGYRPRGSPAALARQYYDYGYWKRIVLRRHPASLRPRQLAAPLLALALAASVAAAAGAAALAAAGVSSAAALGTAAAAAPAGYAALLAAGAAAVGIARRARAETLLLPAAWATMHVSWGAGFLASWLAGRR